MERASYRDVVIPRIRLRSCSALIAPTRILDQTRPYLRQLSFDEWDIRYSRATFMRPAENKGAHRLLAQAWIPNGGSLKLRAYHDKPDDGAADIGTQTLTAGSSGLATATFDEAFLDPAYPKKVLPAGCVLHISMEYDGTIYDQVAGLESRKRPSMTTQAEASPSHQAPSWVPRTSTSSLSRTPCPSRSVAASSASGSPSSPSCLTSRRSAT